MFGTGLIAWIWVACQRLPYILHLRYLFILKWGSWELFELPHPLFIPLLGAYRFLLGMFGHSGNMIMPVELLNVTSGALTLAGLFILAERIGKDSLVASAATLCLGFSPAFLEGSLRPAPYAPAVACAALTLAFLLDLKSADVRFRVVLAGIAAGLMTAFHTAGIALIPVAAVSIWQRARAPRPPLRLLGAFLFSMGLVLTASYALWFFYHGLDLSVLTHDGFSSLFRGIEQIPRTSIYTNPDPADQIRVFLGSIRSQGGLLPSAAAFYLGLLVLARWTGWSRHAFHREPALVSLTWILSFLSFFILNNSKNGLIYVAMLPIPLLLSSVSLTPRPWIKTFALAAAVLMSARSLPFPEFDNWIPSEIAFLDKLLRPQDLLLTPIAPAPDMLYQRRLDVLLLGDMVSRGNGYGIPSINPEALHSRISASLRGGRRVFYWFGNSPADLAFGAQALGPADGMNWLLPKWDERLAASFLMDCRFRSPNGWRYCRLSPKPGERPPGNPLSPDLRSVSRNDIEHLIKALPPERNNRRTRYLLEWLAESPDDAYLKHDLLTSIAAGHDRDLLGAVLRREELAAVRRPLARIFRLPAASSVASSHPSAARSADEELRRRAREYQMQRRYPEALRIWGRLVGRARPDAKDLSDKAVSEYLAGNREQSISDLRRAIRLSPRALEARASLGAVYAGMGLCDQALEIYEEASNVEALPGQESMSRQILAARDALLARCVRHEKQITPN